jgi:hypothetical protein
MTDVQFVGSAKQWRIWTAVGVVFLCGALVGVALTKAYDNYQQQKKWERGLAGLKPRVMKHLTSELHLSAEQRSEIEAIVTQAEKELLQLRMAQQPRVDTIVAHTIETLKGKLTPQQQNKMDELYGQLQRRWDADRAYVRGLEPGHIDSDKPVQPMR